MRALSSGLPSLRASAVVVFAALGCFTLLPASASAGSWTDDPGSLYLEMSGYYLTATQATVPGGLHNIETIPQTTNANVRFYLDMHLNETTIGTINLAALESFRFGDARALRMGDPEIGVRTIIRETANSTVAPLVRVRFPLSSELLLGTPATNANGVTLYAQESTGQIEASGGIQHSHRGGRSGGVYFDESIGVSYRGDYPAVIWFDASMWAPLWSMRWSSTLGLIGRINVQGISDRARELGDLANGVGETAQYVGFFGRIDFRFTDHWSLGGGIDGAFWHVGYASAPGFVLRMSYSR